MPSRSSEYLRDAAPAYAALRHGSLHSRLCSERRLAERGGFEPPVRLLTVQRFSKPPPSATRPSLRRSAGIIPESSTFHHFHVLFTFKLDFPNMPGLFSIPSPIRHPSTSAASRLIAFAYVFVVRPAVLRQFVADPEFRGPGGLLRPAFCFGPVRFLCSRSRPYGPSAARPQSGTIG